MLSKQAETADCETAGSIAERRRTRASSREIGVQNYRRVIKKKDSDDSSDGEFVPEKVDDVLPPPPRKHKRYEADSDETASDEIDDLDMKNSSKNAEIGDIIGISSDQTDQYLAQFEQKSIISSSFIDFSSTLGSNTERKISEFRRSLVNNSIISNLSPKVHESLGKPVKTSSLFIERIIAHQSDRNVQQFSWEILDQSKFLPSYPMEVLPPHTQFDKMINQMQPPNQDRNTFLSDDGIFVISAPSLEKDEEDFLVGGEENAYFLIKWVGLPEEKATWETINALRGTEEKSLFCAANGSEFDRLLKIYWRNSLDSKRSKINLSLKLSPDFEQTPFHHNIELNSDQKDVFRLLVERFSSKVPTSIKCCPNCSRTLPFMALFHSVISQCGRCRPFVVVSDSPESWVQSARLLSDLYYIVLPNSMVSRQIILEHEFFKNTKGDLIIVSIETFAQEESRLKQLLPQVIVFDTRGKQTRKTSWPASLVVTLGDAGEVTLNPSFDSFKSSIVLVPNLMNSQLYTHLNGIFRTRSRVMPNWNPIIAMLSAFYSHPFLISEISSRRSLKESKSFCSDKLNFIKEFMNNGGMYQQTAIVANGFNTLRIINQFLYLINIKSVFLNSPNPEEKFDYQGQQVVLMTREFLSPNLDLFGISNLIFYDVNTNYKRDLNIAELLKYRNPNLNIIRLMTKDSPEIMFFAKTIKYGAFDACSIPLGYFNEGDILTRIAVQSVQPWSVKSHDRIRFDFTYPDNVNEFYSQFYEEPYKKVESEQNFWINAFIAPQNRTEQSEIFLSKGFDLGKFREMMDAVARYGILNWMAVAATLEIPPALCESLFIETLSVYLAANQTDHRLILAYIFSRLKIQKPLPQSNEDYDSLFRSTTTSSRMRIEGIIKCEPKQKMERMLEQVENRITVDAYKALCGDQIKFPSRYVGLQDESISLEDFEQSIQDGCTFGKNVLRIVQYMDMDCIEHLLLNEPSNPAQAIYKAMINGTPKDSLWSDEEVNNLLKQQINYGIQPTNPGETLIAATRIFTKTADEIEKIAKILEVLFIEFDGGHSLVFPKELSKQGSVIEWPTETVNTYKTKILAVREVMKINANPKSVEFRRQAFLDPAWSREADIALIHFTVTFGIKIGRSLFDHDEVFLNHQLSPRAMTHDDIEVLHQFYATKLSTSRRLNFLITLSAGGAASAVGDNEGAPMSPREKPLQLPGGIPIGDNEEIFEASSLKVFTHPLPIENGNNSFEFMAFDGSQSFDLARFSRDQSLLNGMMQPQNDIVLKYEASMAKPLSSFVSEVNEALQIQLLSQKSKPKEREKDRVRDGVYKGRGRPPKNCIRAQKPIERNVPHAVQSYGGMASARRASPFGFGHPLPTPSIFAQSSAQPQQQGNDQLLQNANVFAQLMLQQQMKLMQMQAQNTNKEKQDNKM